MTIEDLRLRHSVRTYTDRPIPAETIRKLNAAITDVNTHEAGMHFQLQTDDPAPFQGFGRSYGMFSNVRNYIACVADTSYSDYMERAGYFGMQILMKACVLGLDTCFVSGTFSASHVGARIRVGEKLLFLITLGYGSERKQTGLSGILSKLTHRNSLTPMDFLDTELSWEDICLHFPMLLQGLEAVSYAPSAMNRQPVGILIKERASTYNPVKPSEKKSKKKAEQQQDLAAMYDLLMAGAATDTTHQGNSNRSEPPLVLQAYVPAKKPDQLIDLGIAMYSFQVAYPGSWTWGNPATFHPLPDE